MRRLLCTLENVIICAQEDNQKAEAQAEKFSPKFYS